MLDMCNKNQNEQNQLDFCKHNGNHIQRFFVIRIFRSAIKIGQNLCFSSVLPQQVKEKPVKFP